VKKENLPNKIKQIISSGQQFQQQLTEIKENGLLRKEWTLSPMEDTQVTMNEIDLPPNNTFRR